MKLYVAIEKLVRESPLELLRVCSGDIVVQLPLPF